MLILHKRTEEGDIKLMSNHSYGRVPLILCVCFIVIVVRLLYLKRYNLFVSNYNRYMGVCRTEAGVGAPTPPPPPTKNIPYGGGGGLFCSPYGSLFTYRGCL